MAREIAKAYEPQQIEQRWAEFWVKEALFKADPNAPGPVFSIVIPPPNVTGSLHIGHMLEHTEIDILTRWHRMRGYNTLFLPGMDHAGISTQRVVVKYLADQGINYQKLGREEFEKQVWKWKEEAGGQIIEQMKGIGESCDWSREKFTLSPEMSRKVREVFVRLYEEGLIYRATRLVNWCPDCLTVLSDLEVVHEERQGHLWYIKYPVVGTKEFLTVATTRPETMLGDTAVAVHPEDERYKHLVGKKALLPLMNREIPIIGDEMVDREFGTGAVKVTPAHDPNDFELGKRHKLAEIDVMTDDAHMNANAGAYKGMDRFAARKRVVEDLKAEGLLEKITDHTNAIGLCERSKTVVEPRISTQWFCKMKDLAAPAIKAVEEHAPGKENTIYISPENRRTEYLNWMHNIRDWTISRQLWWGHRIPAWYCRENRHITVAREAPVKCGTCGSSNLEQDPDVLDTWFSSQLWPFSTLGWPEETADFKKYYPTSLMINGYDILFFWVARMIMMGLHFTGIVPFRTVYLHALVRTGTGEKMSKSKGTGLDPVALNQQYGTDAMRFCLASMAAPGTDIILSDDKLASARNFANKIWNAARFLFVNLDRFEQTGAKLEELAAPEVRAKAPYAAGGKIPLVDSWLFARLAETIESVNDALANYRFHEAAQNVYQFFWGDFCDWYIEWVKPDLQSTDRERAIVAWKNLFAAFDAALRLLHPFMPFLTEELWHQLPQQAGHKSIALDRFPEVQLRWKNADDVQEPGAVITTWKKAYVSVLRFLLRLRLSQKKDSRRDLPPSFRTEHEAPKDSKKAAALEDVGLIQDIVTAARNARAELKIDPKRKVSAECRIQNPVARNLLKANEDLICRLAVLSRITFADSNLDPSVGVMRSTADYDFLIRYVEGIDRQAEIGRITRLKKEIDRLERSIEAKRAQYSDLDFRNKAPHDVVENLAVKMVEDQLEQKKLKSQLEQLQTRQTAGT